MTRDELIEAMARIIALHIEGHDVMLPDFIEVARASFAALEAARPDIAAVLRGEAVVVPSEASGKMQDAVWLAAQLQNANAQYAAMVEAAQKEMER